MLTPSSRRIDPSSLGTVWPMLFHPVFNLFISPQKPSWLATSNPEEEADCESNEIGFGRFRIRLRHPFPDLAKIKFLPFARRLMFSSAFSWPLKNSCPAIRDAMEKFLAKLTSSSCPSFSSLATPPSAPAPPILSLRRSNSLGPISLIAHHNLKPLLDLLFPGPLSGSEYITLETNFFLLLPLRSLLGGEP